MRVAVGLVIVASAIAACRPQPGVDPAPMPEREPTVERRVPDIAVYEIAPHTDSLLLTPARGGLDPFAGASNRRVTLTTSGADARMLIIWLAQQAGVSLVVSDDVRTRVSVAFRDVLAVDALRQVMAEAGVSVLSGGTKSPWAPVVFYQLPVNIDTASAEVIAARFGVSLEMARFIVESRPRP